MLIKLIFNIVLLQFNRGVDMARLIILFTIVLTGCRSNSLHNGDIAGPLFYDLTAPDGSKHYLLGTMHVGVGIDDLNDAVVSALHDATIFISEITIESFMAKVDSASEKIVMPANYSLKQQLGQDYWLRLRSELPDVASSELDSMHPGDAVYKMLEPAVAGMPREQLLIDLQISIFGRENGKKNFGLDTSIAPEIVLADTQEDTRKTTIADLKEALDNGGIEYVKKFIRDMRVAYLKGDTFEMTRLTKDDGMDYYRRDHAWVASGVIQKNCVGGETCLIYVGAAHIFAGRSNLAGLLRSEGYTIERRKSQVSFFERLARR